MDLRKIKTLLQLMSENGLAEMELEEEGFKIKFSKGVTGSLQGMALPVAPAMAMVPTSSSSQPDAGGGDDGAIGCLITSPMPGTLYLASGPGQSSFVKIGDVVDEDTVVCIVEAMKVMNEIKAECTGRIAEILAENGEPVEYGKPLFRVV
jgi:acetyl-CoA carboxylase biotin carboxyl carrier protein